MSQSDGELTTANMSKVPMDRTNPHEGANPTTTAWECAGSWSLTERVGGLERMTA